MFNYLRSPTPSVISSLSGSLLTLLLLTSPTVVFAHAGHGNEFHQDNETTQTIKSIQVDTETAKRLDLKVEPVQRQTLANSIKTTGQIETLPNQQVEVTTPIAGAKIVELLVQPGATVKKGQPVAVVTSPDLITLRVESEEKLAQSQADLQQAEADLKLAQQNYQKYQQIAASEIAQAQSQVNFAQEKYNKDQQLADDGALPQRNVLESQTQLAQAKAELTKAKSRRDVIAAENQLKRAQAAVKLAKSNINRSKSIYQTRLAQLGTLANDKGLVVVTAPIAGKIVDREVTLGQTFEDAGGKLMTIVNDNQVFATANIYEKDISKVRTGQQVNVKITAIPNRTFTGKIAVISSVVSNEARVIPVKAEINNPGGILKPGMFAELEVLTDETSSPTLAIPSTAVVEANNKQLVYIQNGNAFQPVEVTLGQTAGDIVEVLTGLFEGDIIVTQRAPQLYAQSLRGDVKSQADDHDHGSATTIETSNFSVPWWMGAGGGVILSIIAFSAGMYCASRHSQSHLLLINTEYEGTGNKEQETVNR